MPKQMDDLEKFLTLSEKAESCIIKRLKDVVKIKLRHRKTLYTYKVDKKSAEEIIHKIKCKIIEV